MRRVLVVIGLALALLAAGCGDDDDGATETGAGTTATEETTASGEGPQGELSEAGIGAVAVGATTAEAEEAFGGPDAEKELPGCELAGPNATPVLQWTWDLDDGSVSVDFDAGTEELISYRTTSASLPTANGARVGDTFQALRDAYGPTLRPLQLGAPPTPQAGLWYVGKPGKEWLLFQIAGGQVRTIQGGNVQICE